MPPISVPVATSTCPLTFTPDSTSTSAACRAALPPRLGDHLSLLRQCAHLRDTQQVHALMLKSGYAADRHSAARLMELYASPSGCPHHAAKVLHPFRREPSSSFMYNSLMRGHILRNQPLEALFLLREMLVCGVRLDRYSLTFALKACGMAVAALGCCASLVLVIHAQAVKREMSSDPHVRNKLIHVYALAGALMDARKVFDANASDGPVNVVAWNSLLRAYAEAGDETSLRALFSEMSVKDCASWTTLMVFHIEAGNHVGALVAFQDMQRSGVQPNRVSLICALSAVALAGAVGQGFWIHAYAKRHDIELDARLTSALINMYSKCGYVEAAYLAFHESQSNSVDVWNSMLAGFTANGHGQEALDLLTRMKSSGIPPNHITYSCVLNACSHRGLVDEGMRYFEEMTDVFGIEPDIGHYGCMVDLSCRAGRFERAKAIIRTMPMQPDPAMWKAVLAACNFYRHLELGEMVGMKLIEFVPDDHAGYVLLSNLYAMANKWDSVRMVRKMMRKRGVKKTPGCSSIESDGIILEFPAGDTSHSMLK